jgi:hypothetical protein
MENKFTPNSEEAKKVCENIHSDVFDKKPRIEYNVQSFSELEIQQCHQSLKHNGYKAYFNNGFLTAKKAELKTIIPV